MRTKTIDQVLKVIHVAKERYKLGHGIDDAYGYAVNHVAREYNRTYQTIGDGCSRRLGLDDVSEFRRMLKSAFDGNDGNLRRLLKSKTTPEHSSKIDESFSLLQSGANGRSRLPDVHITYTIQLPKADSDVLKALAQLQNRQPDELLAEVAAQAVKEKMKRAVNEL
ncbi:MAG TPA: hypothetical protein VJ464_21125 [Blastocatellia bacterium]|nr:hypothetical protein [Blastocatellia bacterium]